MIATEKQAEYLKMYRAAWGDELVKPLVALSDMGYDLNHPCTGRVLVEQGPIKLKRYRFSYRVGDGHVLYRWGRLISARKQKDSGLWVFTGAPR